MRVHAVVYMRIFVSEQNIYCDIYLNDNESNNHKSLEYSVHGTDQYFESLPAGTARAS